MALGEIFLGKGAGLKRMLMAVETRLEEGRDKMLMHAALADHRASVKACAHVLQAALCMHRRCLCPPSQYATNAAVKVVAVRDKPMSLCCALRASDSDFTLHLPMHNHLVQALFPYTIPRHETSLSCCRNKRCIGPRA
jgi:hypothetical protein